MNAGDGSAGGGREGGGRVLLVTGGSRGIGAAIARAAAADGWDLCINYARDAAAAEGVAGEVRALGRRAVTVAADVGDADQVDRMMRACVEALGPPTGLVNNAGITGRISRLEAATPATLEAVIRLNLLGPFLVTRAAIPLMSVREGGTGGAVVMISSGAATLGSPGEFTWYAATKGGLDTAVLGLSKELAEDGIRVNGVAPGLIETTLHADGGEPERARRIAPTVPLRRAGRPEEVAAAVLFLLSDAANYVTGAVLRVAGGR